MARFINPLSRDFKAGSQLVDDKLINMAEDFFTNIDARMSGDHIIKSTYEALSEIVKSYGLNRTNMFDRLRFIRSNMIEDESVNRQMWVIDSKIQKMMDEIHRRAQTFNDAKDLLRRILRLLHGAKQLMKGDRNAMDGASLSIYNAIAGYMEVIEAEFKLDRGVKVSLYLEPSVPTNRGAIDVSIQMIDRALKV